MWNLPQNYSLQEVGLRRLTVQNMEKELTYVSVFCVQLPQVCVSLLAYGRLARINTDNSSCPGDENGTQAGCQLCWPSQSTGLATALWQFFARLDVALQASPVHRESNVTSHRRALRSEDRPRLRGGGGSVRRLAELCTAYRHTNTTERLMLALACLTFVSLWNLPDRICSHSYLIV